MTDAELDRLVAEKVLGKRVVPADEWKDSDIEEFALCGPHRPFLALRGREWSATSAEGMLAVIEAMAKRPTHDPSNRVGYEFWCCPFRPEGGGWFAAFDAYIDRRADSRSADTLPRAVALAALAAIGGDGE